MTYYNIAFKIQHYKQHEIHSVTGGIWKYDIYYRGRFYASANSLREARNEINLARSLTQQLRKEAR